MEKPNLAIAYAMKKKTKKMKDGGEVDQKFWNRVDPDSDKDGGNTAEQWGEKANNATLSPYSPKYIEDQKDAMRSLPMKMAEGGMAESNEDDADMITRIMHKRKMMAEGGVVADEPEHEMDSHSADFDYLSSGDLDDTSTNSGEADGDMLGNHQEDEDRHSIVDRIMKQRKMKNTNPRPA